MSKFYVFLMALKFDEEKFFILENSLIVTECAGMGYSLDLDSASLSFGLELDVYSSTLSLNLWVLT